MPGITNKTSSVYYILGEIVSRRRSMRLPCKLKESRTIVIGQFPICILTGWTLLHQGKIVACCTQMVEEHLHRVGWKSTVTNQIMWGSVSKIILLADICDVQSTTGKSNSASCKSTRGWTEFLHCRAVIWFCAARKIAVVEYRCFG